MSQQFNHLLCSDDDGRMKTSKADLDRKVESIAHLITTYVTGPSAYIINGGTLLESVNETNCLKQSMTLQNIFSDEDVYSYREYKKIHCVASFLTDFFKHKVRQGP